MQSCVIKTRLLLLMSVLLLALSSAARALQVIPMTMEETVYQAEAIFVGRVTGGQSRWGSPAKRWIVTDYAFEVEETLLANPETKTGRPIVLPFWGGTLGEEGQGLGGLEHPVVGQRYLIMLRPNYRGFGATPAVGITHGLLQVVPIGNGAEEIREYEGQPLYRDAKGSMVREAFLSANSQVAAGVTRAAFTDWLRINLKRIKAMSFPARPAPDFSDPRILHPMGKTPIFTSRRDDPGVLDGSILPTSPEASGFLTPLPDKPVTPNDFVAPETQAQRRNRNLSPQYVINRQAVVPMVFNQLPASFTPWSPEDQYQMGNWNYYGSDVFRIRTTPTGTFSWQDGVSDECGFISEATLNSVYGLSWAGGVLAWTSSRWFTSNNLIVESDVSLNNGVGWTLDQSWILDGSTAYSYRQVLSHELGHAHGLGHENNYVSLMRANVPGVFAAFSAPFMDNTEAIRVSYPARAVNRTDLGIYLFNRNSSGNWVEATFPSSVVAGNTLTVNDYQLENAGTATVNTPTVEWYLNARRDYNGTYYGLGSTTYPALPRFNYFATNSVSRTLSVPLGTAAGDYYLSAFVRGDEGAGIGAFPFNNSYGWSRTKITVRPRLTAISVSPSTVTGGQSSTGTATLSTATPTALTIVTTTSNGSVAYPANVTISAGQTSGTFNITTSETAVNRAITIGGSAYGVSASTTLTVLASIYAPTNLNATSVSASQIDLAWQDHSGIESGFRIERKDGLGGAWQEIAIVGASVTTYSDTGLAPSSLYVYRVRAYNGGTNSAYSNESGARTQQALYTVNGQVTDQGAGIGGVLMSVSGVNIASSYFTGNSGAAINDNSTVTNVITVPNSGSLLDVHVNVNISHTYIGDLRVTLIAPDGTSVLLHNRTGGTMDNLITLYPDVTTPAQDLAALAGTEINGNWTLRVEDLAGGDTGVFNSWSLEIQSLGAVEASALTAADGTYSVPVPAGDYTVTPSALYYEFSPASQSVSVTGDVYGINFAAIASTNNSISGRIMTADGTGIAGVVIQAETEGVVVGYAVSGADGTYLLNGLPETTYTVTPISGLFTFSPVSQDVTIGPSATSIDFVADAAAVISGVVDLQQAVNLVQPIIFDVRAAGGTTLFTTTLTLGAGGEFTLPVPLGSYDIAIKGSKWLQRVVSVDASAGSVSGVSALLLAGDATNDNVVDISDLLVVIGAYNQVAPDAGYLDAADFNCDGADDISDLLLLIGNYNRIGDQ